MAADDLSQVLRDVASLDDRGSASQRIAINGIIQDSFWDESGAPGIRLRGQHAEVLAGWFIFNPAYEALASSLHSGAEVTIDCIVGGYRQGNNEPVFSDCELAN